MISFGTRYLFDPVFLLMLGNFCCTRHPASGVCKMASRQATIRLTPLLQVIRRASATPVLSSVHQRLVLPSVQSRVPLVSTTTASFHTTSSRLNSNIVNIQDEEDFTKTVMENSKPVIVDFHASYVSSDSVYFICTYTCIGIYKYSQNTHLFLPEHTRNPWKWRARCNKLYGVEKLEDGLNFSFVFNHQLDHIALVNRRKLELACILIPQYRLNLEYSKNTQKIEAQRDRWTWNILCLHLIMKFIFVFASWCGPCKLLGPSLESLVSAQDGKVLLAKVDIDELGDIAIEHDVSV